MAQRSTRHHLAQMVFDTECDETVDGQKRIGRPDVHMGAGHSKRPSGVVEMVRRSVRRCEWLRRPCASDRVMFRRLRRVGRFPEPIWLPFKAAGSDG
jgi:hypothetical protein